MTGAGSLEGGLMRLTVGLALTLALVLEVEEEEEEEDDEDEDEVGVIREVVGFVEFWLLLDYNDDPSDGFLIGGLFGADIVELDEPTVVVAVVVPVVVVPVVVDCLLAELVSLLLNKLSILVPSTKYPITYVIFLSVSYFITAYYCPAVLVLVVLSELLPLLLLLLLLLLLDVVVDDDGDVVLYTILITSCAAFSVFCISVL